jgi:hypothetical protein
LFYWLRIASLRITDLVVSREHLEGTA